MCNNSVSHRRTKHINLRHHYIRELIQRRILTVIYHPSEFNPADLLTKALGHILFRRHRDVLFGLHRTQGWVQNPLKSVLKDRRDWIASEQQREDAVPSESTSQVSTVLAKGLLEASKIV